jgi:hypothetical protein
MDKSRRNFLKSSAKVGAIGALVPLTGSISEVKLNDLSKPKSDEELCFTVKSTFIEDNSTAYVGSFTTRSEADFYLRHLKGIEIRADVEVHKYEVVQVKRKRPTFIG